MSRDLPEPWRTQLERKGITSKRGLATKAGIAPQTAKRLIDGTGSPSVDTVKAVADFVFNGDRRLVWELVGHKRQDHGEWSLPPEASLLDPAQREAVIAVVRAMLPAELRRGAVEEDKWERRQATEPTVTPELLKRAAREGRSEGREIRKDLDKVGEESQVED